MRNTYWEYNDVPVNQLAQGYRWINNQWVKQPMLHDGAYGAMGGLITTLEDFARYVAFHENAYPSRPGDDNGVVKRSSVREMHFPWNFNALNTAFKYGDRPCPSVSAYAYGLRWEKDCDQRVALGHSGGLPGFGSNWRFLPEFGIGIICFANLTYAPAGAINITALDRVISESGLKARTLPASPILEQRKQQLAALLPDWKNAPATGIFADNFFLDYFPDSLRKEATGIFAKAGKIQSVSAVEAENNLRGGFTLQGEKANIWVYFTLTPQNPALIQEYHIQLVPR
ncbi:MAG: serine hydrolase [Flavihumibacter sp.]